MTRCTGARQRAIAALLAAAAIAPSAAIGAEASALPPASTGPVGVMPPDLSCTQSTPRVVDPPPSAVVDMRTTTTTVDWVVRASALFGQLVTLALAIACGLLAWASFIVLREALGLVPRPVVADPPRSALPAQPDSKVAEALPPPGAATPPPPAAAAPPAFSFKRHWGGFGGGSTGWVVSERLVRVIVGLVLAGLAGGLGMQLVPRDASAAKAEVPPTPGAASAAKAHD